MILFSFNDPTGSLQPRLGRVLARCVAEPARTARACRGRRATASSSRVLVDDRRDGARDAHRARAGALRLPRARRRPTCSSSCRWRRRRSCSGASLLTTVRRDGRICHSCPEGVLFPLEHPDDHDRPHHVQHQLRGRDREGPAAELPAPSRGSGDGPRRERVDDLLEGHVPADPARHPRAAHCWRSACRSTTTSSRASRSGQTQTFPLYIYGSQLRGIPVQVNVIGTIIFVGAVGSSLLTTLWQRRVAARDYASRRMTDGQPGGQAMVETDHAVADSPARPRGRAAGLEPDHQPRRGPRRGLVADHPRRRRATSTTRPGSA